MFSDGGYTEWTEFSPCTATCDGDTGHRVRRRFCTNPPPSGGGLDCSCMSLISFSSEFPLYQCQFSDPVDKEEITCVGDTPFQSDDPNTVCYFLWQHC